MKIKMWERACSRKRWFSCCIGDYHTAFASKLAPTSYMTLAYGKVL